VEIPLSIYEEITGQGELPPPVDEADFERRKHRRVPFGCRATIFPERKTGDNTPSVVMVRDMSVAGLSILNTEPLKPGTPFLVEFRGRQDRPVKIRCAAARCESGGVGGSQFLVGATFEALLTEELKPTETKPPETTSAETTPLETEPQPLDPSPEELVAATTEETGDPVDEDAIAEALQPDEAAPEPVDAVDALEAVEAPEEVDALAALEALDAPEAEQAQPQEEEIAAPAEESQPAEETQESEPDPGPEPEPEPEFELIDQESEEQVTPPPTPAEPAPVKPVAAKPAPAPAPKPAAAAVAPAPAAKPKTSSLFSGGAKIKPLSELPDGDYGSGEAAAPKAAAAATPPEAAQPQFRVIAMPMPEPQKQAAAEMEPEPQDSDTLGSDESQETQETHDIRHAPIGAGMHHEILARAKQALLAQSSTIKTQQQQIFEQRKQMKKLADELAALKHNIQDLQGRVTEDDSAFAELADVLDQTKPPESRPKASEAA
jgi:uncharacterized coiled-coil protein SlyX